MYLRIQCRETSAAVETGKPVNFQERRRWQSVGKGPGSSRVTKISQTPATFQGPSSEPRSPAAVAVLCLLWSAGRLVLLLSALQLTTLMGLDLPLALWHLWFESYPEQNASCARVHTGYAVLGVRRCCLWLHWASSLTTCKMEIIILPSLEEGIKIF